MMRERLELLRAPDRKLQLRKLFFYLPGDCFYGIVLWFERHLDRRIPSSSGIEERFRLDETVERCIERG